MALLRSRLSRGTAVHEEGGLGAWGGGVSGAGTRSETGGGARCKLRCPHGCALSPPGMPGWHRASLVGLGDVRWPTLRGSVPTPAKSASRGLVLFPP